uniref:Uncharacterized protein n=1 Tax=Cannabis sativa TaxID=3483 RepID=A0A803QQ93_CANSA
MSYFNATTPSTSLGINNHIDNPIEPVRVAIPLEITPAATHIVGDSPSINIVGVMQLSAVETQSDSMLRLPAQMNLQDSPLQEQRHQGKIQIGNVRRSETIKDVEGTMLPTTIQQALLLAFHPPTTNNM